MHPKRQPHTHASTHSSTFESIYLHVHIYIHFSTTMDFIVKRFTKLGKNRLIKTKPKAQQPSPSAQKPSQFPPAASERIPGRVRSAAAESSVTGKWERRPGERRAGFQNLRRRTRTVVANGGLNFYQYLCLRRCIFVLRVCF